LIRYTDSINKTSFSKMIFTLNIRKVTTDLYGNAMYSYQHVVRTQGELNKQSNIYTNNVGLYRKR